VLHSECTGKKKSGSHHNWEITMLQHYINFTNAMALRKDEKGASAVEYGLLVAAIAALIVAAVFVLGNTVLGVFTETNKVIANKG
jgi:pilus assembly protein Flp/PilA